MAVRKINESTLTAIGNAIRAKTGGSALINPEDMASEIESIQTGGGGSLPSQISVIDGGSFTPTADVQGTSYWINHNLGVVPKQVVVWTDDNDLVNTGNAVDQRYLIFCGVVVREYSTGSATNGAAPVFIYRNTNGQAANTGSPMTSAQKNLYFTSSQFCVPTGAIYLKANTEYKWIAFA